MTLTKAALECLEMFDQSTAYINDKRLVAWIRLQVIAEDVEASRVKLLQCVEKLTCHDSNSVHQDLVQTLENRLGEWRYAAQTVINCKQNQVRCKKRHSFYSNRLVAYTFFLLPQQALRTCNLHAPKSRHVTDYLGSSE